MKKFPSGDKKLDDAFKFVLNSKPTTMGEIFELPRTFPLYFLHIHASVTVMPKPEGYVAFIKFPRAYVSFGPEIFHGLPFIIASNIDEACMDATVEFKKYYAVLDRPVRCIGAFNFYLQRTMFRTCIERSVGDFKAQFVITRQFYCISENIDGIKWGKSTFDNRERTSSYRALFLINYTEFFEPIHLLGFNAKFIGRLLAKYNRVKATQLRLYDNGAFVDDLEKYPDRLTNHVADHREDFEIAVGLEKLRRRMKKDL